MIKEKTRRAQKLRTILRASTLRNFEFLNLKFSFIVIVLGYAQEWL